MEKAFLAAAYVYEGKPRHSIVEVGIVRSDEQRVLYERENGVREWWNRGGDFSVYAIRDSLEAAELWCADRLDAAAAPILAAAAALREAAAARVAAEEVAVV